MLRQIFKMSTLLLSILILGACQSNEQKESNAESESVSAAPLPSGEITFTPPKGWISEPPSSQMRKAQFKLPGVDDARDAELVVFFFPGTGGTVNANLERWYGQFKQPDGSSTADKAVTQKMNVNGIPVTTVFCTGTFLKSQSPMMMAGPVDELPDYALLAAIAETTNGPWFFKATGPQETIDHWRESFDEFVQSLRAQ